MRKNKFKFQTHHFSGIWVEKKPGQKRESPWFLFFFHIGNTLVKILRYFWNLLRRDWAKTAGVLKQRITVLRSKNFVHGLAVFFIFCLVGWGLLFGARLLATALNLKDSLFSGVQAGLGHISQASQALADQNTAAAGSQFQQAYNSFSQGKQALDQGNKEMLDILNVLPQTQSARGLLEAAAQVSRGGQEIIKFYSAASSLSFSAQGLESSGNLGETLGVMDKSLNAALEDITSANQKLLTADLSVIPAEKKAEFIKLSSTLAAGQTALANLKDVFTLAQKILMPKSTILVLFENDNELRPGGGFIGTYGRLAMDNGKINNMTVSSIYDLDGQLQTKIAPPNPLLNVNDRWYMRDSNWFADFQDSATKASNFYEMEGGQTPQDIIAITPSVITSLLGITGPVNVPSFNTILTADNFIEKTQAISTLSNNLSLNQPKQILADFFPVFMQKLKTLSVGQGKQILSALLNQLQQKQIVLESSDPEVQSWLESFNWAGKVFDTDRDYLQMVSANLGGTKTDLALQKKLDFVTRIDSQGRITDDLTLTVTNQLPNLQDTQNTSFVRFLVPQGAKLISITGFDQKTLDDSASQNYRQDPQVVAWENGMVKDVSSGTLIGTESGKTFFGNWLTVQGGQTRTIHLTYTLPFTLKDPDRYALVLQKQIGSQNTQFNWTVRFEQKKLDWESFVPNVVEANNLTKSLNLNQDYFLGLVLENR